MLQCKYEITINLKLDKPLLSLSLSLSSYYLKSSKEVKMFRHSQPIKQHIVLWTYAQITSYQINIIHDTESIDMRRSSSRWEETS